MSSDWLERWQLGRIGWHEEGGNKRLQQHWKISGKRVLVPLCGKSRDLLWLQQQGNEVVGVELSEIAAQAFFDENELAYDIVDGEMTAYVAKERPITIYCGDYFAFSAGPFSGYYDRGALVAIAPELRVRYVQHTRSLLETNAAGLVVTVEYDQSVANGPPYSISAATMQALWPDMERADAFDDMQNCPPKFIEAGLNELLEVVYFSGHD